MTYMDNSKLVSTKNRSFYFEIISQVKLYRDCEF